MQVTVETTPTRLDDATVGSREIVVLRSASAEIRLGAGNVNWADGWPYLDSDNPLVLPTNEDGLWAVTETGTATVEVLSI